MGSTVYVTMSRGVRVSHATLRRTIEATRRLREVAPVALYALREHARDEGYPLTPGTLRVLRAHGLAGPKGVSGAVRAVVADVVSGAGLALTVRGEDGATAAEPATTSADGLAGAVRRYVAAGQYAEVAADLLRQARVLAASEVGADAMVEWTAAAATLVDRHGAARPELQDLLTAARKVFDGRLAPRARALFVDLAATTGASLRNGPGLPLRRVPYWQKEAHPLENHQSTPSLPARADVVIVGSGLIGGAAALHIADAARRRGLRVVLLDAGEVSAQATGRNGGNIEAIPENFFGAYGTYDGFVEERFKFLRAAYPGIAEAVLRVQAQRIAETIIRFAHKNAALLLEDAEREGLDADISTGGWLRVALNRREEAALKDEVALGRRLGIDMRVIGPREMKRRFGLESKLAGRLVEKNGNFHPFKFVVQEIRRAVEKGVLLHTNTKVTRIVSKRGDLHLVQTTRGTIRARRVIVAVNAFTSELFPQLGDIRPFRSQIVNYNHVPNTLRGITFTAKDGDIYGNFPAQDWYTRGRQSVGTLHLGGGKDTEFRGPWHARPSPAVYRLIVEEAKQVFPVLAGKVPVRTWAGPMAFVEGRHGQRMPVIGELGEGPLAGVLITVWCNGYGGTGCHKTGAEAARWALTGRLSADAPPDVFGVQRLLSDEPMFDPERGGPRRARNDVGSGRARRDAARRRATRGKPVT